MELRGLGRSDLQVSLVGIGCNNFGGRIPHADARAVLHAALDAGVTLFDTSDNYGNRGGSERFLGAELGARRNDIVLASKFGMPMDDEGKMKGGTRRYIMAAIEASLERLRTDRIDLYQLHVPDPDTPIEETLRALDDLVRQGKVRHVGCSNLSGAQTIDAARVARAAGISEFITCQNEYSLLNRDVERELIPAMRQEGPSMLPFYPLASGLLSGKYQRDQPLPSGSRMQRIPSFSDRFLNERNWAMAEGLQAFATSKGRTLLELAFSWLANQPVVGSVIAGASSAAQVRSNVAAVGWTMTAEELKQIDKITLPGS